MRITLFFLLASFVLAGCDKDDPDAQFEEDRQLILDYLSDNNLQAEEDPSGLFYHITEEGTSSKPTITSAVKVFYEGRFLDGTVFDEAPPSGEPFATFLSTLIPAWRIGLPLIGKGGKITLYVPSILGYGSQGSGRNVPPNTVLIFDVELVDFNG